MPSTGRRTTASTPTRCYDAEPGDPATDHRPGGAGSSTDIDQLDAAFFGIAPREAERLDPAAAAAAGGGLGGAGGRRHARRAARRQPRRRVRRDVAATTTSPRTLADSGRHRPLYDHRHGSLQRASRPALLLPRPARARASPSTRPARRRSWPSTSPARACGPASATLALAGGVERDPRADASRSPTRSRGMMAPDGRCKFGDAAADGYVRSEGRRSSSSSGCPTPLADGDRVHAVIRGTAVNQDGRSSGLDRAEQPGQEAMLRGAPRRRRRRTRDGRLRRGPRHRHRRSATRSRSRRSAPCSAPDAPAGRPCLVGSLKSNIGHTEGAAGVAGLIKAGWRCSTARCRRRPLRRAEPDDPVARLPVASCPRPRRGPPATGRAAPASARSASPGTNAHVVLEEAPSSPAAVDAAAGAPSCRSRPEPAARRARAGRTVAPR